MESRHQYNAWLIKEKIMARVITLDTRGITTTHLNIGGIELTNTISLKKAILLQSTGFVASLSYRGDTTQDRTVYEGDIVKYNFWNGPSYEYNTDPAIIVIEFDNSYMGYADLHLDYVEDVLSIEIIGNKYEHPHLLPIN